MNGINKNWPQARGLLQPLNRQAGHAIRPVVAQLKTSMSSPQVREPIAPPAYRPQPTPKVLQCKSALVQRPVPVTQKWPGTRTIQRSALAVTAPVDDKKDEAKPDPVLLLREQLKAAKKAAKAARAAAEEKALAERKQFYPKNAQQAHVYIQGRSASQIREMKFVPRLFRTYECKGGGLGGEYMFNPIGHGLTALLAQSVIHVHWDATYNRQYGHFKNHTDKTKGGGSLGAIDAAKLDAMNVPAQETAERVLLLKEE